jgi:hypothetical protein
MFAPNISGAIAIIGILFLLWAFAFSLFAALVQWFVERRLLDDEDRFGFFSALLRAVPAYTATLVVHGMLTDSIPQDPFNPSIGLSIAKLVLFVALATSFQWVACLITPKDRPLLPSAVAVFFSVAVALLLALGPILALIMIGSSRT